jgi:hypothetical protein
MARSNLHGILDPVADRDAARHAHLSDAARRGFDRLDLSRRVPRLEQRWHELVAAKVRAGHAEDAAIALAAAEQPELYEAAQDLETIHLQRQGGRSTKVDDYADAHGRVALRDFNARTFSLDDVPGTRDKYNANPSDRRTRNAEVEGGGPGKKGNASIADRIDPARTSAVRNLEDDDPEGTLMTRALARLKKAGQSLMDKDAFAAAFQAERDDDPELDARFQRAMGFGRNDDSLETTY